jgi:tRNA(fMet)-specific endonuclease VapC
MIYLLDTNVCIALMRGKKPQVTARFTSRSPNDLSVASVVVGELLTGAVRSHSPVSETAKVDTFLTPFLCLPFDLDAARRYAEIRADLEKRGLPISDADLMIAAIALVHGLTLVTNNTREFSRVPGLSLEDWEQP